MTLSKSYEPDEIEDKWVEKWVEEGTYDFDLDSDKEVYSIDTPPPFTSGNLHMGHILAHSWIDLLARYKRMRGYNVYFPQGFDCHGLPTEMKVESKYNTSPHDREEFLKYCKEWTQKCIKKMKEQFKKLGYSADWDYEYHTMDDDYTRLVQHTLLTFYEKGLMYREKHPIMWCPRCETALAKAEVGHVDKEGRLYELDFNIKNRDSIRIATTRPEFLPACVAVVVHPGDERYNDLIGEEVELPIYDRVVPIIGDEGVDTEFGTGAVYLCTYGDEQDITWQKRHDLPVREVITKTGELKNAGFLNGLSVEDARKEVVERLRQEGVVKNAEKIQHSVLSHTERSKCNTGIELIPLTQWFIKIEDYTSEVLENANSMNWYPEGMIQRLKDWCNSMDWDWIISRQRAFGTPIPFWYCKECGCIIKPGEEELPVNPACESKNCPECGADAVGETDVCDCWVDSSITPLKICKYLEDEEFFEKTYPTSVRPQGYEIIRTWLFYTLYRCYQLTSEIPWQSTVINGMVGGTDGRKMSKSLGNVVNPDEVFEEYSVDAVRQWALSAGLGEDFPFSWKELEYGKKFLNKLWNIGKFTQYIREKESNTDPVYNKSDEWITNELNKLIQECTDSLDENEINTVRKVRNFIWHEFADYYIEMVKYRIYGEDEGSKQGGINTMNEVLKKSLLLLAPYTPFITEELWTELYEEKKSIHLQSWPEIGEVSEDLTKLGEVMKEAISLGRQYKINNEMSMGAELDEVIIKGPEELREVKGVIKGTLRIQNLNLEESKELKIIVN